MRPKKKKLDATEPTSVSFLRSKTQKAQISLNTKNKNKNTFQGHLWLQTNLPLKPLNHLHLRMTLAEPGEAVGVIAAQSMGSLTAFRAAFKSKWKKEPKEIGHLKDLGYIII